MRFGLLRFVALPAALLSPPLLAKPSVLAASTGYESVLRAGQAPAVREMLRRARP